MKASHSRAIANVANALKKIDQEQRVAASAPKRPVGKPLTAAARAAARAALERKAGRSAAAPKRPAGRPRTASEEIQTEIVNGIVDVAAAHGLDITHGDVLKSIDLGKLISGWKSMEGFKR